MIDTIIIAVCSGIAGLALGYLAGYWRGTAIIARAFRKGSRQHHRDRELRLVKEPDVVAVEAPPDRSAETRPDAKRPWRSEQLAKLIAKRKAQL